MPYADPGKRREQNRRWEAANREKTRRQHRESARRRYAANPEQARQRSREKARRRRHGRDEAQVRAGLYADQGGCCWLCGEPGELDEMVIDHDHRCCPPNSSCSRCRRGLAHEACNLGVSYFRDDPERLRRVADNLAEALLRLGSFPEQPALFDLEDMMADTDPDYTTAAIEAMVAALDAEHDFAEWLSLVLVRVAALEGSVEALTAGRPGSWESALVEQLVKGVAGYDGEHLPDVPASRASS